MLHTIWHIEPVDAIDFRLTLENGRIIRVTVCPLMAEISHISMEDNSAAMLFQRLNFFQFEIKNIAV